MNVGGDDLDLAHHGSKYLVFTYYLLSSYPRYYSAKALEIQGLVPFKAKVGVAVGLEG